MKGYNNPLFLRLAISLYGGGYKHIAKVCEKINAVINSCDIHRQIKIGENTVFMHSGKGCVIHEATVIGNNVRIFHNVTIGCKLSGNTLEKEYAPVIEDNVLIGAGAVILGNIRVGKNSIIGANSVVLHDVAANTVVAGVPAKVIKAIK